MKSSFAKIAPMFLSNYKSATVILPIELARKYQIEKPCYVTFTDNGNGVLIKKLQVKE
jgi:hypothetical protein